MRNKRVRALRRDALEIMPVSIKTNGIIDYGFNAFNQYKNFIRRHRKANR